MMNPLEHLTEALARRSSSPDGRLDRGFLFKSVAVGYFIFCATYIPINLLSIGRAAHTLYLPGEERIPFIPEFEFLYVWGYVFPLLIVVKMADPRRLVRLAVAFALTLAVAYTTYLIFPVYLERPLLEVDSLAMFLLSLEYLDPSYNHFPSLHVATACLVYLGCRNGSRRPATLLAALIGISVSTLFIKQHYAVDVVFGALLAMTAWAVAGRWITASRPRLPAPAPIRRAEARP